MAKTILLADDSITIQKIVNLTFSGEGIDVVTVGNGDAAIKKIYDIHPDLVLADIFMPGKNGYEVCEYIKSQPDLQRTPIILLVGAFEPFDSNEAARVKADGHLTKPFEIKVLISAVNSLISAAEEVKVETQDQESIEATEALSAGITIDSAAEPETEGPVLVMQPITTAESSSSELQSGLASPTFTPASLPEELLSTENPVVEVDGQVEPVVRLTASEDLLDTARPETPTPQRPSISVEDFDPLGLFASEPVAAVGLRHAETPLDSKGLVVDIWEPRSAPSSELEVPPDVAADHIEDSATGKVTAFRDPASTRSELDKAHRRVPVDYVDEQVMTEAPVPSLEPSPTPLARDYTEQEVTPILRPVDQSQLVDVVVQKVMEKLSKEVIEKIAWEVVPDLAELIIKEHVESHLKASGRV